MMNPAEAEEAEKALWNTFSPPEKKRSNRMTETPIASATTSSTTSADSSIASTNTFDNAAFTGISTLTFQENANQSTVSVNIYQNCVNRINELRLSSNNPQELKTLEDDEWAAAQDMATEEESEYKNALEIAKEKTADAKKMCDNMITTSLYGTDYANIAFLDLKIRQSEAVLIEARLKRAQATLKAIKFRKTAQRPSAENKLRETLTQEVEAMKQFNSQRIQSPTPYSNVSFSSSNNQNRVTTQNPISRTITNPPNDSQSSISSTSSSASTRTEILPVVEAVAVRSYSDSVNHLPSGITSQKKK